jgi:steroid 5-alpha reductase family enzyme
MIGALSLAVCLVLLWLLSLRLRDSSIIDLFWGPAFSVLFWPTALAGTLTARSLLLGALVSAWGLRLGLYLAWRNLGHGEDKRYTAMRTRHGPAWWWRSLFVVFGLQGFLAFVVSWPIRAVATSPASDWSALDAVATALVLLGLAFETVGDLQLARFKRSAPRGAIMDRGLWRYTRHPNYFGDFVVWLGFGLFGLGVGAWWSLLGPLVMTVLLVKVSGKELLEKGMAARPGYADYVARTSGFFPWPPH